MTSSRRLRWLLVATHLPASGHLGGMVRYVVELATELGRRSDIELHLLVRRSAAAFAASLTGDPARVVAIPDLPTVAVSLAERAGVPFALHTGAFDVVHGTKHLLPRHARGLRLLTVYDFIMLDRPRDFPAAKRLLLGRPYLASIRAADVLLTISAATRDRLVEELPAAAPRAVVVPLATATALRAATPAPVAALDGRPFALVVGDPSPRKNLALAVRCWAAVEHRHPEAVLAVVGPPGWGVDSYGEGFDTLVRDQRIVPLGHVGDPALRWLYENARAVLCPSLLEGFGLPAAEALTFGAPLVTSPDPALVEASAGRADHVSWEDVDGWSDALHRLLARPRPPGPTAPVGRTWAEVADETVAAVRRATA